MPAKKQETITIKPLNIQTATFNIVGTAPYVQSRFSKKAMDQMAEKMVAGSTARKGRARESRDFDRDYQEAMHKSIEGWIGIPASAFRAAMIDACRTAGFTMTYAKMSIFVQADGFDEVDAVPLVKIVKGEPRPFTMAVRNANGVADLRCRPIWDEWEVELRLQFDADQFTLEDVTNLLVRVGAVVGIGEGRPYSKKSCGMGWGTFRIKEAGED